MLHKILHSMYRPRDITEVFQFLNQSLMNSFAGGLVCTLHKLLGNRSLHALDAITLKSGEKRISRQD